MGVEGHGSDGGSAGGPIDVRGLLSTTKERVAEVLEATERAASEILAAADREAEQLVREAQLRAERLVAQRMERISILTESVMAKAGTIDRELDGLRDLMSRSLAQLSEDLGVERSAQPPEPAVAQPSEPTADRSHELADADREDALQILATELLSAGETVEGASRRMVEEFGVQSPRFVFDSLGIEVTSTRE